MKRFTLLLAVSAALLAGCTQEQQNKLGRSIQNWTGTDGVLDENLNGQVDPGEKRVYFEIGEFNAYVFYENPH